MHGQYHRARLARLCECAIGSIIALHRVTLGKWAVTAHYVRHTECKAADNVTPVTHQPCTSALDPMWVQPCHMGMNGCLDHGRPISGMDC